MNRRETIQQLSILFGGTLSAQLTAGLMGQVTHTGTSVPVGEAEQRLLADLAEVIIPTTDTPGAKAAGVDQFIIRLMRDCYVKEDQEDFYRGLAELEARSKAAHGKGFCELEAAAKNALVKETAARQKAFFKVLRELTVAGYFTSEVGATQAVEYLPVPGRFLGAVPMKPGQKAWAI
ncbi:MAG: gluconate 2-dehydrogenase subunit 3 family protein [Verrucomicrobiales bacterium]|nr:gluconate 2-dehydrogenase subunit 3 family protein [Verrucomicrobiales bacterium]HQW27731.1 gluconate 2-dehydrogenase subunit 3 family protein [Verrucomicrobiales bacterium]